MPAPSSPRDDRVHPLVRAVALLVIGVLVAAVWVLYLNPETADINWAWTIRPRMSAMAVGAGYVMGIVFFALVLTTPRWHRVAAGFLPIGAFCVSMALITVIHLDRFHGSGAPFWLWVLLYAVTPFLVPALWLWNRGADDGSLEPGDVPAPPALLASAGLAGAGTTLAALAIFLMPALAVNASPWALTPLTARAVAGWMLLPGVGGLMLARERRWSGWRVMLASMAAGVAATLLALPFAWSDFNPAGIATWVYVALLVATLAGSGALWIAMERRRALTPVSAGTPAPSG